MSAILTRAVATRYSDIAPLEGEAEELSQSLQSNCSTGSAIKPSQFLERLDGLKVEKASRSASVW